MRRKSVPGRRKQIYVEILVRSSMERLWALSQDPALHPRWDLRFSRIIPTGAGADGHSRFRYEFQLPFYTITGSGTSLGIKTGAGGPATSVLKFSPSNVLSPIGPGSGYWRYVPSAEGIRFITGYNYTPGLGAVGRKLDRQVIRPALGWATALSFDRLRLWAEYGVDPAVSRNAWLVDAAGRAGVVAAAVLLLLKTLLLRAALRDKAAAGGGWLPLAGSCLAVLAAAAAAAGLPHHPAVPRAGRCLRRPLDRASAEAPESLATLSGPDSAMAGPGGLPGALTGAST